MEERTERYVEGNMAADDKLAEAMLKSNIYTPLFNKYQNEFLIQSTRKNATKKNSFKGVINTRVRKEIKKTIRVTYAADIHKKEKYDIIKKYESKTGKNTCLSYLI
jgi:hypothetical protein